MWTCSFLPLNKAVSRDEPGPVLSEQSRSERDVAGASQDSICVASCSTSLIPDTLYHKSISQSVSKNVYHSWPPSAKPVDSATKTNHFLMYPQIQKNTENCHSDLKYSPNESTVQWNAFRVCKRSVFGGVSSTRINVVYFSSRGYQRCSPSLQDCVC